MMGYHKEKLRRSFLGYYRDMSGYCKDIIGISILEMRWNNYGI